MVTEKKENLLHMCTFFSLSLCFYFILFEIQPWNIRRKKNDVPRDYFYNYICWTHNTQYTVYSDDITSPKFGHLKDFRRKCPSSSK